MGYGNRHKLSLTSFQPTQPVDNELVPVIVSKISLLLRCSLVWTLDSGVTMTTMWSIKFTTGVTMWSIKFTE